MRLVATLGLLMMLAAPLWAADSGWYPSRYGADDEIGAANNLSPDVVVQAAKLVKTGRTYALGVESSSNTPAYAPRYFHINIVQPDQQGGGTVGSNHMSYNDELVNGWLGVGSQIDGLGHLGINHVYYNGNKAQDFAKPTGLTKLGIEKIPPLVTRGVLIDMAAHFGVVRMDIGQVFNSAEIKAAAKAQGVAIQKGDVVLFHTGWGSTISDPALFSSGEPGLGREGAQWLADQGVVAVGADSNALEVIPHEDPATSFEVHQILLAKNGVYILENMNTAELARDKAYEFLFVLGQARISGAVQMIINPVAIR